MNNTELRCATCGHRREDHDDRLPTIPCLVDWYGHVPGCECEEFVEA